ncbi:MAG TPA: HEAT repeat domain-containing protein [Polyangiaceae bacterium]|nr:HEAT repeat domain-containing protein [Polyangiaceae bacterium]
MRRSTLALIVLLLGLPVPATAAVWPSAVQRVERDLHSQDVDLRRRAAQSLRELPKGSGARLASAALDDSDVSVRLTALDACLGFGLPALGDRLIPWLSDGERRLRLAAAEALSESPSARAVPSLGRALGDGDAGVRSAAAAALGKSAAPEAALALLGHLDDGTPEVRRVVALALGDLGDPRAVVPLIGKIQDARPPVREAVARALAQLADPRSSPALVLALRDADDGVRVAALAALARIGDPSTVASISALLANGSDAVVAAALDALSQLHTPDAAKVLIEQLAADRPRNVRSGAIQALSRSGPSALGPLRACLSTELEPERLGGCALALGQTRDLASASAIQEALRRGALKPEPALLALSQLGAPESLPTVLEYLADPDVLIRRSARLAARALLDPNHPDGRAVEPIEHALGKARHERGELAELLDLLGQTGAPRAARSLLPFAASDDEVALRSRALSALGFLGEAGQWPTLWHALDDDSGSVRLAAASALGRLALPGRAATLLDRLAQVTEQERPLLLLALGGTLSVEQSPEIARRLATLLVRARDGERDALIELLGRMPAPEATTQLASIAGASTLAADRAKFAEALAAHPSERARLVPLLSDQSLRVRANAAWSLAEVGTSADRPALEKALHEEAVSVAGNALSALARIAQREHGQVANLACPLLSDERAMLRAISLRALRFTRERCPGGQDATALSRDRSEFVRKSAAALLRDVPRGKSDLALLTRARDHDPSGAVAAESEARPETQAVVGRDPTLVVVIAAGQDAPSPAQPFALLRADGLVRLGLSDRRGQVFELAPRGMLSLLEPIADFE